MAITAASVAGFEPGFLVLSTIYSMSPRKDQPTTSSVSLLRHSLAANIEAFTRTCCMTPKRSHFKERSAAVAAVHEEIRLVFVYSAYMPY